MPLFVYGTLRPPQAGIPEVRCCNYAAIAQYVAAAEPAWLVGAALYDVGMYPAARSGAGTVQGDLLYFGAGRGESLALAAADQIEGHPAFFTRARVMVQTAEGSQEAWIYWAPEDLVAGRPRIAAGDWLKGS